MSNTCRLSFFAAASLVVVGGCKGPSERSAGAGLEVPDQASLAVQWQDGPRRENAEVEVQRNARDIALRLFPGQPMGSASNAPSQASEAPATAPTPPSDPSWVDGVSKPAAVAELDFPRAWPVEVRRGETPALLAEWSGVEATALLAENAEALKNRRWLKTGDRIQVVMSANQKASFDRRRENFQRERIEAYFARRYFEKIIVYRVKRGEYIAQAAKRLGDVPLWLIEEFNQTDFRGLQPGDEILIPVVASLEAGKEPPQGLLVVDEDGRPIAAEHREALKARLEGSFQREARMALDDSNVFMRPRAGATPGTVMGAEAIAGDAFPRPMPAAHIGGGAAAHAAPAWGAVGAPAAEVPAPAVAAPGVLRRDVVVKRGESLLHYVKWSESSLDAIRAANPHLDPDRIFVGTRISIPMSDEQFTRFVVARASWEAEKTGATAETPAAAAVRTYEVRKGDNATAIARRAKVSMKALKDANPGVNLSRLRTGQKLTLPSAR